jgi:hypothetical protein
MKISDLYLPYMAEDCYLASPWVSRFHIRALSQGTLAETTLQKSIRDTRQMTDLS